MIQISQERSSSLVDTKGLVKKARAAGEQRVTDLFTSVFFPLAKHLPTNSRGGEDPQLIDIPLRFGEGHSVRIGTYRRAGQQYMLAELQGATDEPIRVIRGMTPNSRDISVPGFTKLKNLESRQLAWLSRLNAKNFDQDAIYASLEEAKSTHAQLEGANAMRKQAAKSNGLVTLALDANKVAELEARSKNLPVWEVLVGEGSAADKQSKTIKPRRERTKANRRTIPPVISRGKVDDFHQPTIEVDVAGAEQTALTNAKNFFTKVAHAGEWKELIADGDIKIEKLQPFRERIAPHSWLTMSLKPKQAKSVQAFLRYMENVATGQVSYPIINNLLIKYGEAAHNVIGSSFTGQSKNLKLAGYLSSSGSQTAGAGNKDRQKLLFDLLTAEYASLAEKETNNKAKRSFTQIYGWMNRAADFMHKSTF